MDIPIKLLPGQALSSSGRPRLDYAAVARLAFPFMLNSAVQAVLNATDTWFIGRLSPAATAAIGAVYWPILVFLLLFGGVGLAVQTVVAQAYGGGRFARAVLALSWGFFVPLAHMLSFKPGAGWVVWLPQFGFGAIGGWFAALAYICCLGIMLSWRWRSGAWRRAVLPLN